LTPPAGRADDYSWPRREVGIEQARGDPPVAATPPEGNVAASNSEHTAAPIAPPRPAPRRPPVQQPAQWTTPPFRDFFGFGAERQPPPPRNPSILRPPGNI